MLQANGTIPADIHPTIVVTRTRDAGHGDFASNLAMMLAGPAARAPRDIARALIEALPSSEAIREVFVAGPGFINFYQADDVLSAVVRTVLSQGAMFGRAQVGAGQRVMVTFVSADLAGPVNAGQGRGAAVGASMANLMEAVGFEVQREYHVDDAGRQMDILATSVWLGYLDLVGESVDFPCAGYEGSCILSISQALLDEQGERLRHAAATVFADIDADEPAGGDKDRHIDALVLRAKELLDEADYRLVFDRALRCVLDGIRQDLGEFGVHYDHGLSEHSLSHDAQRIVDKLDASGYLYEEEGVRWFRSTGFGDDKDRPLDQANGQSTCLASDIACIDNRLEGGFDKVLHVVGAEQHGYTARRAAACEALGHSREKVECLLIQSTILFRGDKPVSMSTDSGSIVTVRELCDEVGKDAARFFHVMRKFSQHLDFDLDLARSQSSDNPVYHVQYAYARICSVMRQLDQRRLTFDQETGLAALSRLGETAETNLMTLLAGYPELIQRAALAHEPHQLTGYLRDLANGLHSYYNAHKVLVDDDELRHARLCLLLAVRQVLGNGLSLIGVSTPEVM